MIAAIITKIQILNWTYGYGDVLGVVMDEDWTGGTVTIKRTSCEPETRRFKFNLATHMIRFAGRRLKVK